MTAIVLATFTEADGKPREVEIIGKHWFHPECYLVRTLDGTRPWVSYGYGPATYFEDTRYVFAERLSNLHEVELPFSYQDTDDAAIALSEVGEWVEYQEQNFHAR